MNLYRINVIACSPGGSHDAIQAYVIAATDRDCVKWLIANYMEDAEEDYEPEDISIYGYPSIPEGYDIRVSAYGDEYILAETFVDAVLITGTDPRSHSDYYYGVEIYGWKLCRRDLSADQVLTLLDLDVAVLTDAAKDVLQQDADLRQ